MDSFFKYFKKLLTITNACDINNSNKSIRKNIFMVELFNLCFWGNQCAKTSFQSIGSRSFFNVARNFGNYVYPNCSNIVWGVSQSDQL